MAQETVQLNQSLADIALQKHGTIEAMTQIAVANNVRFNEGLKPGETIAVAGAKNDVTDYFRKKNIQVAAISDEDLFSGIGYQSIGEDTII